MGKRKTKRRSKPAAVQVPPAPPQRVKAATPPRARSARLPALILPAALVVTSALVVYSNAMPAVAIHDDAFFVPARHTLSLSSIAQIFREDTWASTASPQGTYRPLVILSLAINGAMFGSAPVGYHSTNVAMHAMTSLLVFLLLVELLGVGSAWVAASAAVLFAVHPIHTEAVDSVFNRSEILATAAVVAALVLLARWHEGRTTGAWSAAALLYLVGLLCRESAVSLPALAALLLWLVHGDEPPAARLRRIAPAATLVVPLGIYFAMRHFALASVEKTSAPALGVDAGQDLASNFFYTVASLREYARMMALPWPLRVSYEDFAGAGLLAAAITHLVLLAAAWSLRRRSPVATFAIGFFYLSLVPSTRLFTSSGLSLTIGGMMLMRLQNTLMIAERVAYLPSVSVALGAAVALQALSSRFGLEVAAGAAALPCIVAGLMTFERNVAWHDAPTLFSAEVAAAPGNGDGWRLLVSSLTNAGRIEEAARACDGQLDQPLRSAQLFNNCGVVYDKLQRDELAMKAYRRAIDLGLAAVGHANLGRVYARLGRNAEAEAEFVAAADAETSPAQHHYRMGIMLMRFHPERRGDARREFESALAIQPDFAAARQSLAQLGH